MYFNFRNLLKKTGLLHTKIGNHNIICSSQKPRKSSLPLKSSFLDAGMGILSLEIILTLSA